MLVDIDEIKRELRNMAPHIRARKTAEMLESCVKEIERLRLLNQGRDENGKLIPAEMSKFS